jgi:hypothetical protein
VDEFSVSENSNRRASFYSIQSRLFENWHLEVASVIVVGGGCFRHKLNSIPVLWVLVFTFKRSVRSR